MNSHRFTLSHPKPQNALAWLLFFLCPGKRRGLIEPVEYSAETADLMKQEKILLGILFALCLALSGYFVAAITAYGQASGTDRAASPSPAPDPNQEPPVPAKDFDAYGSILERGLFGESGNAEPPPTTAPSVVYKLRGTLQSGPVAGAVLDDGTGAQTFYRVNEQLPDNARIVKVGRDRISLRTADGSMLTLMIDEPTEVVTADAKQEGTVPGQGALGREAVYPSERIQAEPAAPEGRRAFPRRKPGRRAARSAETEE